MFDKIKESVQKFSSKSVADEEAVEQLVKDIQRDLIKADVDVSLVSELSDEIREEALADDLPSGLTRKEHVLEIVYNKLEELLGEEAEIEVEPQKILLSGLYGAGKCVAPDSRIQLSDGRLVAAEDLYSKMRSDEVEEVDEGERFEVEGLEVPSFNPNTLEIEDKEVEYLWKLEKDEDLIEVTLNAGSDHSVEVTPEHPFFTLEDGRVVKKRADELSTSDYVAIPRELEIEGNKSINEVFHESLDEKFHYKDKDLAENVKNRIKDQYGSLKEGFGKFDLDIKYAWFTRLLSEKNEVPVSVVREIDVLEESLPDTVVHRNSNTKEFTLPEDESGFLEFLGYLLADGYINGRYLELNSGDEDVIDQWIKLSQDLFGLKPTRNCDKRSESLEYSRISSKPLVKLVCSILDCGPGAKSGNIWLSTDLLQLKSDSFKPFLRAYFDCDGHAEKGRHIEISTKSDKMASQLRSLLLRNNIFSSRSAKVIDESEHYRVKISGRDATKFAEEIGSIIQRKKRRLDSYSQIQEFQGSGSSEMIPVGEELQRQRLKTDTSIAEIQEEVNSYGRYERKGRISRRSLAGTIEVMGGKTRSQQIIQVAGGKTREEIVQETEIGHSQFSGIISGLKSNGRVSKSEDDTYTVTGNGKADLTQLRELSKSDVNWIKISKIETTQKHEYVYDLTVKDNHSFVAENTIVHNTTTSGKLADFYRKRGLKPGVICADTDRPAAYDQLKQLAEDIDVPFYGEKDAEDPVKVVENGQKELDVDVLIVDSAGRNSLNEDLQKELSDIESVLEPDNKYLVMPADIGQSARKQAESFDDAIGLNGVIVTKMDSSAKGGGALVACEHSGAAVKFIGNGERVEDLEVYDPVDFVSEMLGQPDLESLLEKIENLDTDPEKILEGDFTMHDFKEQMESVTGSGMMEEMMDQLPFGSDQVPDNMANMTEEKISSYSIIIDSMTDEEMADPSVIGKSRRQRIAEGAGTSRSDVKDLVKHYRQTKNMVDKFDKGDMQRGGGNMQQMLQKMGI